MAVALSLIALPTTFRDVNAAGLGSLLAQRFVSVPASVLPAGQATYIDGSCPSESRCDMVGFAAGHGIITATGDGGRTWSTSMLSSTSQLVAISCPSPSVCYVGGSLSAGGGATILGTRNSGATWTVQKVPVGVVVSSIGCGSTSACVAVGSRPQAPASQSSVIATQDGGASWTITAATATSSAVPAFGTGTAGLTTVRCVDIGHCWASGPGAWFTPDLGATWQERSPPQPACPPSQSGCDLSWTSTIDIEFQSQTDGWVVGGSQCGGTGVTQCPGSAFHTTNGGVSWTLSPSSKSYPFSWQIACQGSDCLMVTQGFSYSDILGTNDNGGHWFQLQRIATAINALACTPSHALCVAAGGYQNHPALLTLGAVSVSTASPGGTSGVTAAPGSVISSLGNSLATPSALSSTPLSVLVNALITLALILLVTFPSHLFNRTYDENHETIRRWWTTRFSWITRRQVPAPHLRPPLRSELVYAAVLCVGGVLAALLDPRFGINLRSLALFFGAILALLAGTTVAAVAAGVYRGARHRARGWQLRALPSGLIIAGVCVLISRLTNFQPGYLYGLIGGVAFAGHLSRREEGHTVAIASVSTLVVSVVAWLVWVPVSTAASADPTAFGWALLEDFLAVVFVSGMVGLLIGLVPLRFLPGEKLAQWHWGVWAIVFGLASLAVIEVMLRPESAGARVATVPFWTTMGLFLGFGLASVTFWAYFRVRNAPHRRSRQARKSV